MKMNNSVAGTIMFTAFTSLAHQMPLPRRLIPSRCFRLVCILAVAICCCRTGDAQTFSGSIPARNGVSSGNYNARTEILDSLGGTMTIVIRDTVASVGVVNTDRFRNGGHTFDITPSGSLRFSGARLRGKVNGLIDGLIAARATIDLTREDSFTLAGTVRLENFWGIRDAYYNTLASFWADWTVDVVLKAPTSDAYDEWLERIGVWDSFMEAANAQRAKVAEKYKIARKSYLFMVRNAPPPFHKAFALRTKPGDDSQASIVPRGWDVALAWKDAVVNLVGTLGAISSDVKALKAYAAVPAPIPGANVEQVIARLQADAILSEARSECVRENGALLLSEAFAMDIPTSLSGVAVWVANFQFESSLGYRPVGEVLDDVAEYAVMQRQCRKAIVEAYARLSKVYRQVANLDSWIRAYTLLLIDDVKRDARLSPEEKTDLTARVRTVYLGHLLPRYLRSIGS
jgi:hypothetical protein